MNAASRQYEPVRVVPQRLRRFLCPGAPLDDRPEPARAAFRGPARTGPSHLPRPGPNVLELLGISEPAPSGLPSCARSGLPRFAVTKYRAPDNKIHLADDG